MVVSGLTFVVVFVAVVVDLFMFVTVFATIAVVLMFVYV